MKSAKPLATVVRSRTAILVYRRQELAVDHSTRLLSLWFPAIASLPAWQATGWKLSTLELRCLAHAAAGGPLSLLARPVKEFNSKHK